MIAAYGELYIEKGADWSQPVYFKQSDNQTPVDISSWTNPKCQIRKNANDPFVQASPIFTITDGPNGGGKLSLTAAETAAIETGGITYLSVSNYVFDLYITDSVGVRDRALNGPAKISPGVTHE